MLDLLRNIRNKEEPVEEPEEETIDYDEDTYWEEECEKRDQIIADLEDELYWRKREWGVEKYELEKKVQDVTDKMIDERISHEKEIKALKEDLIGRNNQLRALYKEVREYCILNSDLLRVRIEKANADRGIPNKKAHDGYIVISGKGEAGDYSYLIQTPYKASLPYEAIKMQVGLDLQYKDVLSEMGCIGEDEPNDYYEDDICLLKTWKLIVNAKAGFYEIDAHFSAPLIVPERRLPPKK